MTLSEADIASRIASLREEILVLSETHNTTYATTEKLPPEVLSQIFERIAQEPPTQSEPPRAFYTWIKEVTHICRSWRSVALSTPRLWSSVFLRQREWAELVLRRAKSVPLDLKFPKLRFAPTTTETDTDLIRLAFARPEHIRSVDISFINDKDNSMLQLISSLVLDAPFHQLEWLYLSSRSVQCIIPDGLFSQSRLRHLTLKNCAVTLNTPRFSRLRSLYLVRDLRSAVRMDLLGALSTMHELKTISLEDNLNIEDEEDHTWNHEVVQMPSLQQVVLKANFPEPMGLLKVLATPLARVVDVDLAKIRDPEVVMSAYSFLKINQFSATSAPLQRVAISQTSDSISLWQVSDFEDLITPSAGMIAIAGIEIELDTLWARLPKHNIIAFRLDSAGSSDVPPPPQMLDIITSLSNSPILGILHAPYDIFVSLLHPGSFPALRGLVLDCRSRKPRNSTLHDLNDWLIQRQAQGFKALGRLRIIGCPHIKVSIEVMLERLVGVFTCSKSRGVAHGRPFQ